MVMRPFVLPPPLFFVLNDYMRVGTSENRSRFSLLCIKVEKKGGGAGTNGHRAICTPPFPCISLQTVVRKAV